MDAGFWHQFDSSDAGFLKLIRPGTEQATTGEASALRVTIVPNPARSSAEIHVTTTEAGTLDLGVYDVAGDLVNEIQAAPVLSSGVYVVGMSGRSIRA